MQKWSELTTQSAVLSEGSSIGSDTHGCNTVQVEVTNRKTKQVVSNKPQRRRRRLKIRRNQADT